MKKIRKQTKLVGMMCILASVLWGVIPKVAVSDPGKPAARLGDRTAHGGSIIAGCTSVLIGGMPAARVGDMHTCPMVEHVPTPVPHVGGPIIMGSSTVLIGGMPAARLGDTAVCNGPPDSIAFGCPTVLIGTGEAGDAKTYSEDYIKANYDKSVITTKIKRKKID